MDIEASRLFVEQLPFFSALMGSELLLALAFVALTATLMGLGVPGVLVPLSFSSGMMLGGWTGMLVVGFGAVLGCQAFFLVTRRWLAARMRARWGERLTRFDGDLEKRGFFYLLGLRLLGAPHPLVSAASALSPLKAGSFALATLIGMGPAVALAAAAGSAL
jgi:uncharacterized membrane protein YdjX (TVP38/TMEM64 family)